MLLEYLVPSKARRNLMQVLWTRHAVGSVSALARLADVAASAADKEISAMEALGLVSVERTASARVVRANQASPFAAPLKALLEAEKTKSVVAKGPTVDQVRSWLRHYGAPLVTTTSAKSARTRPSLEEAVVHGLRASHADASVARTFPVVLWRNRDRLRFPDLLHAAHQAGQARTLGFFLDLTAELAGDQRLAQLADELKDRRVRRDTFFFDDAESTLVGRELAELNTPPAARRWHFLMNMPMDSFETMFRKATGAPPAN
jgi:hypothetical protein